MKIEGAIYIQVSLREPHAYSFSLQAELSYMYNHHTVQEEHHCELCMTIIIIRVLQCAFSVPVQQADTTYLWEK